MNVKNCRVQVETLAAKVAAYNRGGKHMINCLYEIGRKLTDILPDVFEFACGHVGYSDNLKDSNVGFYGEAFCFVPYDEPGRSLWKPVEEDGWEDAGQWYYLHGDFNKVISRPTRTELKMMAKEIPGFIAALAETLDKDTEDNKEATEVLLKMLEVSGTTEAEISP